METRQQITVKDIISEYLKDNGYDGLYNPDYDCGCSREDTAPCFGGIPGECIPAYYNENKHRYETEKNKEE